MGSSTQPLGHPRPSQRPQGLVWLLVFGQHLSEVQAELLGVPAAFPSLPLTGPCPCPSSGGTELLALSAKGRLMTCSLDPSAETSHPAGVTAANAGRKIKELLCGIGTASER